VIVVGIATPATYYHYSHQAKSYSASTLLYVTGSSGSASGQPVSTLARSQQTADLAVLATSVPVATLVAQQLHFKGDPRTLAASVVASPAGTSRTSSAGGASDFIAMSATGANPTRVIGLVNAFATAFTKFEDQTAQQAAAASLKIAQRQLRKLPRSTSVDVQRAQLVNQIQALQAVASAPSGAGGIKQINPAVPPAAVSAPNPKRNAVFALVIGLVLSIAVIFGLERLDPRIRRLEDLGAAFGTDIIGTVPRIRHPMPKANGEGTLPDAFREPLNRIRTVLGLSTEEWPIRTLMVASAAPKEGKSTVARSLALAYREAGYRVLLIDSDLRNPTIDRLLPVNRVPGLSDLLTGTTPAADTIQRVDVTAPGLEQLSQANELEKRTDERRDPAARNGDGAGRIAGLNVLTSGRGTADPVVLLSTHRMRSVLLDLAADHDIVIIDTPPLAAVSDGIALMNEVDAVLLVGRPGKTTRASVENARALLERVPNVRVLGLVANGVERWQLRDQGYGRAYGA
jgi:succinoglycan biosynthesis transport protein ExoP